MHFMMTIQAVRKDLNEIRYYFARKKRLDDVSELVGNNKVVDMVERYNIEMQNAPIWQNCSESPKSPPNAMQTTAPRFYTVNIQTMTNRASLRL